VAAEQSGLLAPHEGVGIRHGEERRSHPDRRVRRRRVPDRRRRERRRAQMRSVLFTALTLAMPSSIRSGTSAIRTAISAPKPSVTVSVDSFVGIPANEAYDRIIEEASQIYGVDEHLIRSIMQTESAFDPFAVSRAGALGLMQLMPAISREFGVTNPFDPRQNIMAGTRLLRELLDSYRGNVTLAVASYNAGPTAIRKYGTRVPPFRETQNYVKRVTGLYERAQRDESE
jgi:soluble lytic murein transglycosylase-like protein